jgi:hypothetical protein
MNAFHSPDPGPPVFVPVPGHPNLRSDTPIVVAMLLERDTPWRQLAPVMLPRVDVRLDAGPTVTLPQYPLALEPSAVHSPARPAWVKMREEWLAGPAARRATDEVS